MIEFLKDIATFFKGSSLEPLWTLIAVVLGAVLTGGISWVSEKKTLNRSARYLAIRVACVLGNFISDCAKVVSDDGQHDASGEREPEVKNPASPVYPDDLEWKSIDTKLVYLLLTLPNEVDSAQRIISDTSNYDCPPDFEEYFAERQIQYAKLGLKALDLRKALFEKYSISLHELEVWNPEKLFLDKILKIEQLREKIELQREE